MDTYLIIYLICVFIVLGFQIAKANSPIQELDIVFFVGVLIALVIAPITICLIMGVWLHDTQG